MSPEPCPLSGTRACVHGSILSIVWHACMAAYEIACEVAAYAFSVRTELELKL